MPICNTVEVIGHVGDRRHRDEGVEGETWPHPQPCQRIEGQVDAEKQQAEADTGHLLQQQRQPGSPASEQANLMKQKDAEGNKAGRRQQGQHILINRMGSANRGVVHNLYPSEVKRECLSPAVAGGLRALSTGLRYGVQSIFCEKDHNRQAERPILVPVIWH